MMRESGIDAVMRGMCHTAGLYMGGVRRAVSKQLSVVFDTTGYSFLRGVRRQ